MLGYLLVASIAIEGLRASDELCRSEVGSPLSNCSICESSFYNVVSESCMKPKKEIAFCSTYTVEGECSACQPGYAFSRRGCEPVSKIGNCIWSKATGECLLCRRGMTFANICIERKPTIANCNYPAWSPISEEVCLRCAKGFTVIKTFTGKTSCKKSEKNLENCWVATKGGLCLECDFNFYMQNRKCLPSTQYKYDLDWMDKEEHSETTTQLF